MDLLFPSPLAVASITIIASIFGLILSVAKLKLKVDKDPRILQVEEALPGANCGACGLPGCAGYATKIVMEDLDFTLCPVGGDEVIAKVAEILGKEVVAGGVSRVAVVHCCGTDDVAKKRFEYNGPMDCRALNDTMGGDKACTYGCLGQGDCVSVCPFDAIHMGQGNIPWVDRDACTGCGNCIDVCPRDILELVPVTDEVVVMCKNEEKGAVMKQSCTAGCIGCKMCEKVCREQVFADNPEVDSAIKVENFLATIDYDLCTNCFKCVEVCPVPVIHPIVKSKKYLKNLEKIAVPGKEHRAAETL